MSSGTGTEATKMGMSLGLHSKSCAAAQFSSLLALGVFSLVNGESTEGYGCVGSWEEIILLPRSSSEAWAAGGAFGQLMERGKWMGIFCALPRLCHRNPSWVWSSLAEHRALSAGTYHSRWCVCALEASPRITAVMGLQTDAVLAPVFWHGGSCATEEDCPGKEWHNGEWRSHFELSRISVWKGKRFCYNQHGQACVPLSSTGLHSSGLILILGFQTLSPASLPGPALGSMDKWK